MPVRSRMAAACSGLNAMAFGRALDRGQLEGIAIARRPPIWAVRAEVLVQERPVVLIVVLEIGHCLPAPSWNGSQNTLRPSQAGVNHYMRKQRFRPASRGCASAGPLAPNTNVLQAFAGGRRRKPRKRPRRSTYSGLTPASSITLVQRATSADTARAGVGRRGPGGDRALVQQRGLHVRLGQDLLQLAVQTLDDRRRVPAGATMPNMELTSKSLSPASAAVGVSGQRRHALGRGHRQRAQLAGLDAAPGRRARFRSCSAPGRPSGRSWPGRCPCTARAGCPRWRRALNISPARCWGEPLPAEPMVM